MNKGDKKKQQKALSKGSERKRSSGRQGLSTRAGLPRHIREARSYPIAGCWTAQGWEEHGLAVVVVARRQPNGNLVFGTYLVDRYCLGLKNTYCDADMPEDEFRQEYLPAVVGDSELTSISPALAHEIIYGGIAYAARFGFRPHPDFARSRHVLDPEEAHPHTGAVEFGYDQGKPLYVAGPYDNVEAVLRQLSRTAGEGNYDYVLMFPDPPSVEWEE